MRKHSSWILALLLGLILALSNIGHVFARPEGMVQVIIGLDKYGTAAGERLITDRGGIIKYRFNLIPAVVAQVPGEVLPALQSLRQFRYVEPDGEVQAAAQVVPWGIDRIGATSVHPYNQGSGVKVAVIDTGIDLGHSDLHVAGNVSFSGTSTGNDDNGHGTHVAGIVAALDNSIGVVGVAPQAELYAVKVLNSSGSGSISNVVKGIEWAVNNHMDIINMSLGTSSNYSSLKQACDNAYNAGVVVVAAAGNNGTGADSVIYPAKYDSVIAVGATDSSDARASFSNTGPAVELAAPGANIYSTYRGNSYKTLNGTSMASPHVAGVAALVLASGIIDSSGNGRINDEVRLRLQQTADDLGPAGRDTEFGYGLVDADEAVPSPVNHQPVASAGSDQTAIVNTQVTLDGSASYDEDGNALTYLWNQTSGPPVALSDNTAVSPTFTPTAVDTYQFELVVNDGQLDSLPDSVAIRVRAENHPPSAPVIDVVPDLPLTADNLAASIVSPSIDPDGDTVTYSYAWFKNNVLQPGLTGNTVSSSYTAKGEVWKCEVTPNDGAVNGPAGSDSVTIGNTPPVAKAGDDQNAVVNTTVALNGSGSYDVDGDPLTYLWEQTSGPAATLSDSTVVSPTFVPSTAGTCVFNLTVSDGSATNSDSVSVVVTQAPSLVMHVERIDMTLVQLYGGWRTYATAKVTVFDVYGRPVSGATVNGHWENATTDSDAAVTDTNGEVTVSSNSRSRPPSGTRFIFVVDSVAKSGWTYDAAANGETSDSVVVP